MKLYICYVALLCVNSYGCEKYNYGKKNYNYGKKNEKSLAYRSYTFDNIDGCIQKTIGQVDTYDGKIKLQRLDDKITLKEFFEVCYQEYKDPGNKFIKTWEGASPCEVFRFLRSDFEKYDYKNYCNFPVYVLLTQ